MIKTTGITKEYGELKVLKGIDIQIEDKEVVSIVGASGAGKTTLLQIIGTLDRPDFGTISYNGIDVSKLKGRALAAFRNNNIGFVFQFHQLLPEFTALENVCIPAYIAGKSKAEAEKRATELLGFLNLSGRLEHKPSELSGGEQQRIAIASALANDAPILLADEPTGELDTANARIIAEYLVKINRELGKTIIMVTHDPSVARVSTRILRIEDGIIKTALAPSEVIVQEKAVSYVDQIKARITEINAQLLQLESDFRSEKLDSEDFVQKHQTLKHIRDSLKEELSRMGIIP